MMVIRDRRRLKPFISLPDKKWSLLNDILTRLPRSFNRYFEPFLGTGAVFLTLEPEDAVVSDIRRELILTWRTIRDDPVAVSKSFDKHANEEKYFNLVKHVAVRTLSPAARAARFLYLNQTCNRHGGFYENAAGDFCGIFGGRDTELVLNRNNLRNISTLLKKGGVKVEHNSFEMILEQVDSGDFIYLDPPHIPSKDILSGKTKDGFGFSDYQILANVVKELDKRGCQFLLTTTDHTELEKLFERFPRERIEVMKYAYPPDGERTKIPFQELIIRNYN